MYSRKSKLYARSAVLMFLIALIFFASTGYVYAQSVLKVNGNFETGIVKIGISQFRPEKDGTLTPLSNNNAFKNILSGDSYTQVERIQCQEEPCYIRFKEDWRTPGIASMEVLSNGWIKAHDGYYYYTEPLYNGEYVDMYVRFSITDDIPQEMDEVDISQRIRVEAVQMENFPKPDYSSAKPWGGVTVIDAIYDSGYASSEGSQTLNVIYNGSSDGLITNAKDAFQNFSTLMPGGSYSDILNLQNNSSKDVNLSFSAQVGSNSDPKIYDVISLTIDYVDENGNTNTLYSMPLTDYKNLSTVKLCQLKPAETGKLRYTLDFDPEADNTYSKMKGNVTFVFYADEESSSNATPTPTPSATSSPTTNIGNTTTSNTVDTSAKIAPQTGDDSYMMILLAGGGCLFLMFGVTLIKKSKKEKRKK